MTLKPKNIIIFVSIAIILILIYIFFIKKDPEEAALVSSLDTQVVVDTSIPGSSAAIAQDFLTLLLNVKTIRLNDAIFSDPAFASLHDSSITLIPDGNEGRPNPFAPLGVDDLPPAPTTP